MAGDAQGDDTSSLGTDDISMGGSVYFASYSMLNLHDCGASVSFLSTVHSGINRTGRGMYRAGC